ncbi:hypothetical protein V6N13_088230 [Hibiscus sabdariffa]
MNFTGEPASTKKQAQKNATMSAWSALRKPAKPPFYISHISGSSTKPSDCSIYAVYFTPISSSTISSSGPTDQEPIVVAPRLAIPTSCPLYLFNHSASQPLMGETNVETGVKKSKQEDYKQKNVKLESKFKNDDRKSDVGSRHAFDSSHLRPHYPSRASYYRNSGPPSSEAMPVMIRTMSPVSTMRPNMQNPTTTQVPVPPRMRTGAPPVSTGPRFERTNLGSMHPASMAPPVRIRSVVPVCSAPPPSFNQEAMLANKDKKDTVS